MDKKKISLIIIYVIAAFAIVLAIPSLLTFNPSAEASAASAFYTTAGSGFVKMIQIFVAIMFIMIPIVVLGKNGIKGKAKEKFGDQGTAKEGTINDLKGLVVHDIKNVKKGEGGYVLSQHVRLTAAKSYEHVALVGPTGSGKSTSFFIPNLLDADGTHSFVVTDPKGELFKKCGPYLKAQGMDIIKIQPLDPVNNKYHYNPILVAEDDTELREVAQNILTNGAKSIEIASGSSGGGQSDWINMSVPLFAAALAYAKKLGDKKTINEAIDIILGADLKQMEEMFKKDEYAYKQFLVFKTSSGSEQTLSSIKSVLTSNIQLFLDKNVEEFVRTPFKMDVATGRVMQDTEKMFDPRVLRERPTALFVCVPEVKSDYMMPLMSVFYSQLLTCHMNNFDDEKYPTPILYFLDEFANIGVISLIAKITATARSRKIGISLGLQGVEQLKRNYGEENANDILNNLKTKIFLSGLTGDSAKYVSDLAGFTTIESKSYSQNDGSQNGPLGSIFKTENVSKSGVRRELITADEVRRMDDKDVLIIAHNRDLVRDKKNDYYINKKYLERAGELDKNKNNKKTTPVKKTKPKTKIVFK